MHKAILAAEKEADKLKGALRRHLPKSLFLPVPRSDLLSLVSIQDNVANTAKDVSMVVLGRKMRFPDKLQEGIVEYYPGLRGHLRSRPSKPFKNWTSCWKLASPAARSPG